MHCCSKDDKCSNCLKILGKFFWNGWNSQDAFHYDWIWPFMTFCGPRVILEVKMCDFAFFQLLTLNCSRMLKFGSFSIKSKLAGPLGLPLNERISKKNFFERIVTTTTSTLLPESEGYPKNGPAEKRYPPKICWNLIFFIVQSHIFKREYFWLGWDKVNH